MRGAVSPELSDENLAASATVVNYVTQLCGEGYALDRGAPAFGGQPHGTLLGGNEARDPGRRRDAYYSLTGNFGRITTTNRLIVLAATVDAPDALQLVPASHRSLVPPPPKLIDGSDRSSAFFCAEPLQAGDAVFIAAGTLRSFGSSAAAALLSLECTSRGAPPADLTHSDEDIPPWVKELSPAQQKLLWPYSSESADEVVLSDGSSNWLGRADAPDAHPAALRHDPTAALDHEEFFSFDLNGYITIKNVMDDAWPAEARAAIDDNLDQVFLRGIGHDGDGTLAVAEGPLSGTGRPDLKGLFELPNGGAAPFLRMLDHPSVIHRLNWILGAGYLCAFVVDSPFLVDSSLTLMRMRLLLPGEQNTAICSVFGSSGQRLHAGGAPNGPMNTYSLINGRMFVTGSINVVWQLHDVGPDDGGFVVSVQISIHQIWS